jgi:hypothetical protein
LRVPALTFNPSDSLASANFFASASFLNATVLREYAPKMQRAQVLAASGIGEIHVNEGVVKLEK